MAGPGGSDDADSLGVVVRTFEIIGYLADVEEAGVTELADYLDVPKSTAHSYLKTLENTGYAINESGAYRLSLRFLLHAGRLRHGLPLFQMGRAEADRLARNTGEAVNLGVHEDGERVIIYMSEGEEAIWDDVPVGTRTPLNLTAIGKAILAFQPDEFVHEFIEDHGLNKETEYSIADEAELFDELEATRRRGYSIEDEEHMLGLRAFGVPVTYDNDQVIGAMSIVGPSSRFSSPEREEKLVNGLNEAVNIIELRLDQS